MNPAHGRILPLQERAMRRALFAIATAASVSLASCNDPGPATTTASLPFRAMPGNPADTPRPPAPSRDAVWMPASYEWNGTAYALRAGSWSQNVPPTALWQAGHWVLGRSGSYEWVKGHWIVM